MTTLKQDIKFMKDLADKYEERVLYHQRELKRMTELLEKTLKVIESLSK